jgi:hypothetical protein
MVVRSYRRVFDLERRIYRIDRVRLNPGGIPIRGLLYLLALTVAALLIDRLPLLGEIAQAMPWYVRELALPCLCASLLAVIRIEGRPFHLAARALLHHGLGPRRLVGLARPRRLLGSLPAEPWWPPPMLVIPDGSDCAMRRLDYRGPGAVLVSVAHERRVRTGPLVALGLRPRLSLRQLDGVARPRRGEVIVLERPGRLRAG